GPPLRLGAGRGALDGALADGPGLELSPAAGDQFCPRAEFGGGAYLVVWEDHRGADVDVFGARVSPAGAVLARFPVSTAPGNQWAPQVAWDGTSFLVVWHDRRNGPGDVYGTRVSAAGAILDPNGRPIARFPGEQVAPTVAGASGQFLVGWEDRRGGPGGDRRGHVFAA